MQGLSSIKVREGRDSNSRYGYKPLNKPSGVYFITFASKDFLETRKMILLK